MRRETAALHFFVQCAQGVPRVRECGNCGAYLGQHVIRYGAECFRRVGNVCGKKPKLKLVSRKPIVSGEEELEHNPRARSAKLRVAEKL